MAPWLGYLNQYGPVETKCWSYLWRFNKIIRCVNNVNKVPPRWTVLLVVLTKEHGAKHPNWHGATVWVVQGRKTQETTNAETCGKKGQTQNVLSRASTNPDQTKTQLLFVMLPSPENIRRLNAIWIRWRREQRDILRQGYTWKHKTPYSHLGK